MIDDFSKDGYYLKKTIFSKNLIDLYESEFDKIVHQLKKSREDIVKLIKRLNWDNGIFRKDIGHRVIDK